MPDILTKQQRSWTMSRVRSHGNKTTELVFVDILRRNRITGWRRRFPLFGKPDFVFRKLRVAIFIDGCFWHGCARHCRYPNSNTFYWRDKIAGNERRDRFVRRSLRAKGWRVLRIWQHELARPNRLLKRLTRTMQQSTWVGHSDRQTTPSRPNA